MIRTSSHAFIKHNLFGVLVLRCSMGFCTSKENLDTRNKTSLEDAISVDHRQKTSLENNANLRKTVFDQHKHWTKCFQDSSVPEPELSSKYILEHVLNLEKPYEYDLDMEREITEEEENQIRKLCECRLASVTVGVDEIPKDSDRFYYLQPTIDNAVDSKPPLLPNLEKRMPVQYIIKEWDFRYLRLAMAPPVFIPRPETEELVEFVIEKAAPNSTILDVGCGSGAIGLSLLKELRKARVTAIDQSKMACQLTRKNAKKNKLMDKLKVVHSKLQDDGTLSQPLDLDHPLDILVSNPPYVSTAQLMDLEPEIKLYEDLRALEAGRDGLRVVRSLLKLASSILRPGGLMFLEVDSSHPKLIEQWTTTHPELNIQFVDSHKDLCEKDRFVELKKL